MRIQDPAIQPPEALKVQLGEIYQFIFEDESIAKRGCRDVWSDLMQLGVKDSLIADFDTFNSTELKQTFDRSGCESILLDGFQKNKSFLEVAEALNSQCADSLELFVFHCFASAEANAFAVANVSGGTRSLRAVTATAKGWIIKSGMNVHPDLEITEFRPWHTSFLQRVLLHQREEQSAQIPINPPHI